jgi:hypothetical protein
MMRSLPELTSKPLGERDSPILLRGLRKIRTVPVILKPALAVAALAVALPLVGCTAHSTAESQAAEAAKPQKPPREAGTTESRANEQARLDARPTEPVKADSGSPVPAKSVTFDDIKLDLKKGDPYDSSVLTAKVKQLDGKPINIRGYILPSFQQSGIKQFVLVRDNMECCFGPGALLHDCILVEMIAPATANFTVRPVSVEGTFTIHELKGPDGKHLAIYHLDGKQVQ